MGSVFEQAKQFVSTCKSCGDVITKDGSAPRERLCKCGTWVEYIEADGGSLSDAIKKGASGNPQTNTKPE